MSEPNITPPAADASTEAPRYALRLYVSGATPRSAMAIANIKALGERRLSGNYDLMVIDAYQQAELAREDNILVLPTLIKTLPGPLRRLVGDLSDEEQVLLGLGLQLDQPAPRETPDTTDAPSPQPGRQ
jgi:circadian clock protein KaiB